MNENEELLPEIDYWEIEVQCGELLLKYRSKKINPGDWFNAQDKVSVPAAILAFPHIKGQKEGFRFFHPCGTIFPYSNNLTWENGFTAELLRDFYIHSILAGNSSETAIQFASRFNWEKLCNSISAKSGESKESFYNPYYLDRNKILQSIENESFSASLLNVKNCKEAKVNELEQKLMKKYLNEQYGNDFLLYTKYIPENSYIRKTSMIQFPEAEEFQLLGMSSNYSFLCFAKYLKTKTFSVTKLDF